jgi:hypothetical protein
MQFALSPWRSLVAVVIMVMIVITVPAVAPRPHIFQITTAVSRLAAVFTMLAFRIMQSALGVADLLFAPSVIITVKRFYGNRSAQERQNHKRGNECFGSLEHAFLLADILAHMRDAFGRKLPTAAMPLYTVPDSSLRAPIENF